MRWIPGENSRKVALYIYMCVCVCVFVCVCVCYTSKGKEVCHIFYFDKYVQSRVVESIFQSK